MRSLARMLFSFGFTVAAFNTGSTAASAATKVLAGNSPTTGLVQAPDGTIYGTTVLGGGTTRCPDGSGCGTVFRISPTGSFSTIHKFTGTSGYDPGPLAVGPDGTLYGAAGDGKQATGGILYEISPANTFTKIAKLGIAAPSWASFVWATGALYLAEGPGQADSIMKFQPGTKPTYNTSISKLQLHTIESGLTVGVDGALYGEASGGGPSNNGCLIKVSLTGDAQPLYCAGSNGDNTFLNGAAFASSMALAPDGKLYGIAQGGGAYGGGVFFSLSADGTYSKISDMKSSECTAAGNGLTLGDDGNFYAVCSGGGVYSGGTLIKVNTSGNVTVLQSFGYRSLAAGGYPGGASPSGVLLKAADGTFWGTTQGGGLGCPNSGFIRNWIAAPGTVSKSVDVCL